MDDVEADSDDVGLCSCGAESDEADVVDLVSLCSLALAVCDGVGSSSREVGAVLVREVVDSASSCS